MSDLFNNLFNLRLTSIYISNSIFIVLLNPCWPRINVQCMSTPRESDDQWRRKTLTADCSYPSACVLQKDFMPIGFLWLFHPFHLSSCFTFGHGGCSLQRDVFINHVKPQCMNVSLAQSHHYDCVWLKKRRAEYRVYL